MYPRPLQITQVASDIAAVEKASGEINASSTRVKVSAGELRMLAENLTGKVNQFKV